MAMTDCPVCSKRITEGARKCPFCKVELSQFAPEFIEPEKPKLIECELCSNEISSEATLRPKCGYPN